MTIKEAIRQRQSVRTYDGRPLSAEDRRLLEEYVSGPTNPFNVPITFKLLDTKEYGLSSPVIVGADTYLAAKVEKVPHHEIAFGYSFESTCLFALSHGIGTVMLAASLSRSAFEKAMEVMENEVFPLASPVGYPADKRSVRENLMRKGLHADDRKPFEELFFEKEYGKALSKEDPFAEALELARWAPSAGNGQPWRAIVDGESVHFYEAKSARESALGDIKKVDVGIALSHFDLTLQEDGKKGMFVFEDPRISTPENIEYIVSYKL